MQGLQKRERALGTHWWNPPYLVPLVEVIETQWTAPEAVAFTMKLHAAAGKQPAHVKKDVPGFIGNRLQHALWREAIALVENGICDAETVDAVIKAAFGRRLAVLGPLENADMVGTDLTLAIHKTVLPDIDSRPAPSPYLEKLVKDGKLGFKSGEGFRKWTPAQQRRCARGCCNILKRRAPGTFERRPLASTRRKRGEQACGKSSRTRRGASGCIRRAPASMPDYSAEQKSRFEMWWCFGWSYETSVARVRLVFAGLLDRYPKLKIITHHLGGMIPFYDGRVGPGLKVLGARTSDEDYSQILPSLKRPHMDYLHDFYADTAMFGGGVHAHALRAGIFRRRPRGVRHRCAAGADRPDHQDEWTQLELKPADARKIFCGNDREAASIWRSLTRGKFDVARRPSAAPAIGEGGWSSWCKGESAKIGFVAAVTRNPAALKPFAEPSRPRA